VTTLILFQSKYAAPAKRYEQEGVLNVSAHISALVSFSPRFLIYTFLQAQFQLGEFFRVSCFFPPLRDLRLQLQDQLYNTTRAHYDLAISAGKETSHFADLNFQPSNDMATYAVPANSITVNMHIPIMLQQIVT